MKYKKNVPRRQIIKNLFMGGAALAGGSIIGCTAKKESSVKTSTGPNYNWKMVTTWPKNFPGVGTGANLLAQRIETMSSGQIKIKVYGAGEMVPAMGVFDAVSRGTAEMGHGASYYWQGKHTATSFFASVPFGLSAQEMNGWLRYGGGQELWDEVYAPFNLVGFSAGNTGVQMGGWFKKEIKTLEDFKGLKMRMPGLGGQVLNRLGATVVTLPGGEIFQALKLGTIDATEWVGPFNDLAFGFYKAAPFYYWPGWHEPGTTLECMVNKKIFHELPKHLQEIIKVACQAATDDMLSEATARNQIALLTLVNEHKVQLRKFPDEVLQKLGEASREVVAEIASADPLTNKVFQSFNQFRKSSVGWGQISEEGYSLARALTFK